MKRAVPLLMLLMAAGLGCQSMPTVLTPWEAKKPATPPTAAAQAAHPAPLVTKDQVTEANAHEMAKALADELDRDEKSGAAGAKKP